MIYYTYRFLMIVLLMLPFYLFFRKPWKRERKREWALGFFTLFMLGLSALALEGDYRFPARMIRDARERLSTGRSINMIPFHTVRTFFRHFRPGIFMVNIVGNVAMFMPWGFGLPLLWKRRQSFLSAALFSLLLPLFIETVQLFIGRSVDIDDIILNFTGGMLGACCYFLIRKKTACMDDFAR